jgi:hypothetical protein
VFTERYAPSLYIKQISFVFKGLTDRYEPFAWYTENSVSKSSSVFLQRADKGVEMLVPLGEGLEENHVQV